MPAIQGRAKSAWEQNRWIAKGDLQADQTAVDDGKWQPVQGLWPLTITIGGAFTSVTAELRVCNQKRRPADTDNSWPSIYTIGEPRVLTLEQPFIWIKLQVTAIVTEEDDAGISASYAAGGQGG